MRWERWRRAAADVTVAGAVTVIMLVAATESADQPAWLSGRTDDGGLSGWAVVAIAAVGGFVGLSRRAPRTALIGAGVTFVAALALVVPGFSPALALGVPVFMVAWSGRLWLGVAALLAVGTGGPAYRLLEERAEPVAQVALGTLFDLSLLAVLLLLGETLRSRRAVRDEAATRLRLAEQEHRMAAQQQRFRHAEERLRIARDLHDILSHTLALVGIQAHVAAENLRERPERAGQAVAQIQAATREAMADLRGTIAVLREVPAAFGGVGPAPGLAALPDLVESVRTAGVDATLEAPGPQVRLRPAVELAAYRVVQESLTNTLRHARARSVAVVVAAEPDRVRVEVRDDGVGRPERTGPESVGPESADAEQAELALAALPPGSGLRGMAERVAAVGGTLRFGARPDGSAGFAVQALFPAGQPR